jgi:hypothetical protein
MIVLVTSHCHGVHYPGPPARKGGVRNGLALSRSWVTRRPIWEENSWFDPWRGSSHFLRDLAAHLVT